MFTILKQRSHYERSGLYSFFISLFPSHLSIYLSPFSHTPLFLSHSLSPSISMPLSLPLYTSIFLTLSLSPSLFFSTRSLYLSLFPSFSPLLFSLSFLLLSLSPFFSPSLFLPFFISLSLLLPLYSSLSLCPYLSFSPLSLSFPLSPSLIVYHIKPTKLILFVCLSGFHLQRYLPDLRSFYPKMQPAHISRGVSIDEPAENSSSFIICETFSAYVFDVWH